MSSRFISSLNLIENFTSQWWWLLKYFDKLNDITKDCNQQKICFEIISTDKLNINDSQSNN